MSTVLPIPRDAARLLAGSLGCALAQPSACLTRRAVVDAAPPMNPADDGMASRTETPTSRLIGGFPGGMRGFLPRLQSTPGSGAGIPMRGRTGKAWRGLCRALALGSGLMLAGGVHAQDRQALRSGAIDRTEVTLGQYARFVQASGWVTRAEREGGGFEFVAGWQRRPGWTWRQPEGVAPVADTLPAVHLTHDEAAAYCRWAGGRLPTAAEWLNAAYTEQRPTPPAGWVRGRTYPWPTGDSPAGANTNGDDPWPRAAPAGQTRAGVNGLYDMGANVWEWVADAQGDLRRTMGGSWWYGPQAMRPDEVAWKPADFYAVYIGFRCFYP